MHYMKKGHLPKYITTTDEYVMKLLHNALDIISSLKPLIAPYDLFAFLDMIRALIWIDFSLAQKSSQFSRKNNRMQYL